MVTSTSALVTGTCAAPRASPSALNLRQYFTPEILEKQVLTVAKAMEDKIDEEIHALERLDLDDLEVLRERRLQQMKKMAEKKSRWIALGHGEYSEIPNEKEFFSVVKASERVVCHFYRENWPCKVGFDELGGRDDFSTDELEERLAKAQVIVYEGESSLNPSKSKAPSRNVRQGSTSYSSDSD
ncbi:hypothetical protein DH2020_006561 [Rehmannia glutinosa]|uniref:Thioredoxin domain-containing protein n=1 Tax=Rehmannia glutinosa TaxID=99300 RepID=A0ABR0XJC1_REHGL